MTAIHGKLTHHLAQVDMSILSLQDRILQNPRVLINLSFLVLLIGYLYKNMSIGLIEDWQIKEEYSHGFFLPMVALYFLWLKKAFWLNTKNLNPSIFGLFIVLLALFIYIVGELGFVAYFVKLSSILLIYGLFVTFYGFGVTRHVWIVIAILFLSFPLPTFLNSLLTSEMQLMSSQLGVLFIRFFNVAVFLEGNIIDLGSYKLQVVEACSGLSYLFPLLSLSLILAYYFNMSFWSRVLIFVSAIPITILMNSIRIGVTGVLVDSQGIGIAEGFLHDFEGWVIFMACFILLLIEVQFLKQKHEPQSIHN